jgi:hypothetical protein
VEEINPIVIQKDGIVYDITHTALISSYLEEKYIPDVDKLLDWRIRLVEFEFKEKWKREAVKKEIIAVDYLLTIKNIT